MPAAMLQVRSRQRTGDPPPLDCYRASFSSPCLTDVGTILRRALDVTATPKHAVSRSKRAVLHIVSAAQCASIGHTTPGCLLDKPRLLAWQRRMPNLRSRTMMSNSRSSPPPAGDADDLRLGRAAMVRLDALGTITETPGILRAGI